MKKIYLKPEIETTPLFLSACIMSGGSGEDSFIDPHNPFNPAPGKSIPAPAI